MKKTYLVLLTMTLAGCFDPRSEPLGSGIVPDDAFHAQAKAAFGAYQSVSFFDDIEVCGYFGLDADGAFIATKPVRGDFDSCAAGDVPDDMIHVVASYHTHSSFDTESDSEVPSTDDVITDVEDQIFGYIGTPGGRIWLIDWRSATATQLCGLYCLSSDKDFIEGDAGPIASSYTLDDLHQRESE